jgi:putative transposase
MASASLGPALTTEARRPPDHELGHSRPRQHYDSRESIVGSAADPRRTDQAGHHDLGADRLSNAPATPPPAVAVLAHALTNHVGTLVSMDFFTVSTLTGRVLFVLVLLAHQRRRIIHLNVTEHPTAMWTAQQMIEAFPDDTAPRWLLRDRDAIYGDLFRHRVASMRIGEVMSSPSSPWQNPYAERVIGSIRRECLDHMIVLGERHLRRVLARYLSYYHGARTHLSLEKDSPTPRRIQAPTEGRVVAFAEVGGLHHRSERRAA